MTYNVSSGTLNPTQSIKHGLVQTVAPSRMVSVSASINLPLLQ